MNGGTIPAPVLQAVERDRRIRALAVALALLALALLSIVWAAVAPPLTVAPPPPPSGHSNFVPFYTSNVPVVSAHNTKNFAAASSTLASGQIAVTANSVIYAIFGYNNPARTVTNVKDDNGETFTLLKSNVGASDALFAYYSNNVASRTLEQVYVNLSGSATGTVEIVDVTGQNLTSSQQATGPGSAATNTTPTDQLNGANTPNVNNGLLLVSMEALSNPTTSAVNGNTKVDGAASGTTDAIATYRLSQATAAAVTQQIGLSASEAWVTVSWDVRPALMPNTPTGLSIGTKSVTGIKLQWTDPAPNNGISNHTVYQWSAASSCAGAYTTSYSAGAAATSYTVQSLTSATNYAFRVQAWNATGPSPTSTCANSETLAGNVTSLSVTAQTASSISVSWTNPAGTIANSTVFISTTACTGSWTVDSIGSSATSRTESGLAGATKYCIGVQAYSATGTGGIIFTNGTTLPGAPGSLSATNIATTSWTLNWVNPSGTLVNVTIYFWQGSGSCTGSYTSSASVGVTQTRNVGSKMSATTYGEEVGAWSSTGQSALSACLSLTTLPTAVTGLTVTAVTTTSASLSWSNPSGTISNDSAASTTTACTSAWTYTSEGVVTSATLSGLSSATTYCFAVQAYSAGGAGAPTFANATTLPGPPTSLMVTSVTSTTIAVSWSNPSGTLVNDTVYVGLSCSVRTQSVSVGVGTSYTITGLVSATTYCIAVQSFSAGGASTTMPFTNGTTLSKPPHAPTGLNVSGVTTASISLVWKLPPGTVIAVEVEFGTSCGALATTDVYGVVTGATIPGLTPATTYCFQVAAANSTGLGTWSSPFTAETSGPGTGGSGSPGSIRGAPSIAPNVPTSPSQILQLPTPLEWVGIGVIVVGVVAAWIWDRRWVGVAGLLVGALIVVL